MADTELTEGLSRSCQALTEREKQTLRLILRGHDAKSTAQALDLSIHTINERLRDARRKLGVTSSREAARLLFAWERAAHQTLGDKDLGDASGIPGTAENKASITRSGQRRRFVPILTGALIMSLLLAVLALSTAPSLTTDQEPPAAPAEAHDAASVDAARNWLALVDEGKWADSWRETGASFRSANSVARWTEVAQRVSAPLGALRSRTLISSEFVPAPPQGYKMVKFSSDYANRAGVIETLSLVWEGGTWKVVGIAVD